jgi:hypothetical protein
LTPAIASWLAILLLAMANGALREALLIPSLGLHSGTALSGLLLIGAVFVVAIALVLWGKPHRTHAWRIGVGWFLATLVFEFGFGLARGKSWSEILAPYTFKDANLWPLVLVAVLVAPYLCLRMFGREPHSR